MWRLAPGMFQSDDHLTFADFRKSVEDDGALPARTPRLREHQTE